MTALKNVQPPRVLVAGGGVAALEAVLALHERSPGTPVGLIAPEPAFVNRPLSVLEPFASGGAVPVPLELLGERGVELIRARVTGVDAGAGQVRLDDGSSRDYDALVVALGAAARRAFDHALTFRGPRDAEAVHGLVQDVEGGYTRRVTFVVPEGTAWTLPLYELVLQLGARARELCLEWVELTVVTPERRPLEVFGRTGSTLLECLLEEAGVTLVCGAAPAVPAAGVVIPRPGAAPVHADRVVALPRLAGIPVDGLPADASGFLAVDRHGRVAGLERVYAAGDGTDGAIKQGGIAAQQAERAVDALLADAGLAEPAVATEPVQLRAMLVAGAEVWYLRRAEGDADGEVSRRPLWWPPSKLAGRRLAPFLDEAAERGSVERRLAERAGVRRRAVIARGGDGVPALRALGTQR